MRPGVELHCALHVNTSAGAAGVGAVVGAGVVGGFVVGAGVVGFGVVGAEVVGFGVVGAGVVGTGLAQPITDINSTITKIPVPISNQFLLIITPFHINYAPYSVSNFPYVTTSLCLCMYLQNRTPFLRCIPL